MNKEIKKLKAMALVLSTLGISSCSLGLNEKSEEKLNTDDGIIEIQADVQPIIEQTTCTTETTKRYTSTNTTTTTATTKETNNTTSEVTSTIKSEELKKNNITYQGAEFYADEYVIAKNIAGASNHALTLIKNSENSNSIYYLYFNGDGTYKSTLVAENASGIDEIEGIPVVYINGDTKKYTDDEIFINNLTYMFSPIYPDLSIVGCGRLNEDANLEEIFSQSGFMPNDYRIVNDYYGENSNEPAILIYYKTTQSIKDVSKYFGITEEEIQALNTNDKNNCEERELLIKVLPNNTKTFTTENGNKYFVYSNTLINGTEFIPCERTYNEECRKSGILIYKENNNNQYYYTEFKEDGSYYIYYCGNNIKEGLNMNGIPVFKLRNENDTYEISKKTGYQQNLYETTFEVENFDNIYFYTDEANEKYFTIQEQYLENYGLYENYYNEKKYTKN